MKYFKIIIINFLALFFLLIIVENLLPHLTDINIGKTRQIIVQEYAPNSKISYLFNDKIYKKTIDENGNSIDPFEFSSTYSKSIFFLGSSNVETLYVEEGKRLSDLTAKKVNLYSKHKFNGFNMAKGGLNSSHLLISLITKIVPQKPDYIFLMPTNDFPYLLNYGSYNKGPKSHFTKLNSFCSLSTVGVIPGRYG